MRGWLRPMMLTRCAHFFFKMTRTHDLFPQQAPHRSFGNASKQAKNASRAREPAASSDNIIDLEAEELPSLRKGAPSKHSSKPWTSKKAPPSASRASKPKPTTASNTIGKAKPKLKSHEHARFLIVLVHSTSAVDRSLGMVRPNTAT